MPSNIYIFGGSINKFTKSITVNVVRKQFPGSPVVKTSPSIAEGVGSITGQGARIPRAWQPKPKQKTEAIL